MNKSEMFWQTYLKLENEIIEISKIVSFTDNIEYYEKGILTIKSCNSQLETFSPRIADLLIQICVEIEAISKEIYFKIGGSKPRGDNSILFDTDCIAEINKKWNVYNKKVKIISTLFNFKNKENEIITPLKKADKRAGTDWIRAYQAVKHDRYYNLHKATIKVLIRSLAALYLLNIYNRNDTLVVAYQDIATMDFSLGSKIFCILPPKVNQPWLNNITISSESPFVFKYNDNFYQTIKKEQQIETEKLTTFWKNQPEILEEDFNQLLSKKLKEKGDRTTRMDFLETLAEYRISKRLVGINDYNKKKDIILNSPEWNCHCNLDNLNSQEEVNPENIDKYTELACLRWAIDTLGIYCPEKWIFQAFQSKNAKIYIP